MARKYSQAKKKPAFFKFIRGVIRCGYKERKFIGLENLAQPVGIDLLSSEPRIIVGNHAQMHSPAIMEMMFPTKKYMWCIGEIMDKKAVRQYMFDDFWSRKPKSSHWFYKMLASILGPIAYYLFNNADTIAVHKDSRLISTYKETMQRLEEGYNVVIFPEKHEPYNEIINEFQPGFPDVARLYYARYKKCVSFVPMYNAVNLDTVTFGTPIKYDPNLDYKTQREAIITHLKSEITRMAKELPLHKVVPYENVPKKQHPYNKDPKENQ